MELFSIFKGKNSGKLTCSRCKKAIGEQEAQWIGNHRFCARCASPSTERIKEKSSLPPADPAPDGYDTLVLEYIILFTRRFAGKVHEKEIYQHIAVDVQQGNFLIIYDEDHPGGEELYAITARRFLELAEEAAPECLELCRALPRQGLACLDGCGMPRYSRTYKIKISSQFSIREKAYTIRIKKLSTFDWLLESGSKKILVPHHYFVENTIEEFAQLVTAQFGYPDGAVITEDKRIRSAFGLTGNCGDGPVKFFGGYEKDPVREITDAVTYRYSNRVLYISGTGATSERVEGGENGRFWSPPEQSVFCEYVRKNTKEVVFGRGITRIGRYFLSDFQCLEEVVLSPTVVAFDKQSDNVRFQAPPVKYVCMYSGQTHPFGDRVKVIELFDDANGHVFGSVINRLAVSLGKDEFISLLLGSEPYFFPSREDTRCHDYGIVLCSGIYKYFEYGNSIKCIFENGLEQLMDGSAYEVMVAFEYLWRHRTNEFRGTAPFCLDAQFVKTLKEKIERKEDVLKNYKERYEFGASLPNGAWQYINNIQKYSKEAYGQALY